MRGDVLWIDLHSDILPVHVLLERQNLRELAVKSDWYGPREQAVVEWLTHLHAKFAPI